MELFMTCYLLVMLLLVDQLCCAKGERHRYHRSQRGNHQLPPFPISESEAQAHFSRLDSELSKSTGCVEEKGTPQDYSSLSLSPWKYRVCTDPNRYPPEIREAQCLRKDCLIPGMKSSPNIRIHLDSIPLSYTMDVWYRRRSGGRIQLIRTTQEVPIGCTCVRQRRLRH